MGVLLDLTGYQNIREGNSIAIKAIERHEEKVNVSTHQQQDLQPGTI